MSIFSDRSRDEDSRGATLHRSGWRLRWRCGRPPSDWQVRSQVGPVSSRHPSARRPSDPMAFFPYPCPQCRLRKTATSALSTTPAATPRSSSRALRSPTAAARDREARSRPRTRESDRRGSRAPRRGSGRRARSLGESAEHPAVVLVCLGHELSHALLALPVAHRWRRRESNLFLDRLNYLISQCNRISQGVDPMWIRRRKTRGGA